MKFCTSKWFVRVWLTPLVLSKQGQAPGLSHGTYTVLALVPAYITGASQIYAPLGLLNPVNEASRRQLRAALKGTAQIKSWAEIGNLRVTAAYPCSHLVISASFPPPLPPPLRRPLLRHLALRRVGALHLASQLEHLLL